MKSSNKFFSLLERLLLGIALLGCAACGGGGGGGSNQSSSNNQNLLSDQNGDGQLNLLAFGDSITGGVGDSTTTGLRGYPLRLQNTLHVPVVASAENGEDLAYHGLNRLQDVLKTSKADIVLLDEGNSDAYDNITAAQFRNALKAAIDDVKNAGKLPVLLNQYPNCCDFGAGHEDDLNEVNLLIAQAAEENSIPLVDLDRAWKTSCDKLPNCNLVHLPEGVHPTARGYDVIFQAVLATLSGIDIFAKDGAAQLATAYDLPLASIIVKPDH